MENNIKSLNVLLDKISRSMVDIERILSDAGCPYVDMFRKSYMYLILFKSRFLIDYGAYKKFLKNGN